MLAINTNLPALNARRNLNAIEGGLATSLQRLSSGLRVNSAKDDAAGLAISARMTTDIRTSAKLQQGINDGVSLVQVAEGALATTHSLLQRGRELAIQSATGTLSSSDRAALNAEFAQLRAEIDRIAGATQIFDTYPLKGLAAPPPPIPASVPRLTSLFPASGASGFFSSGVVSLSYIPASARNVRIDIDSLGADDDLQLFTRDGKHLAGTPVTGSNPDFVWTHNSQNVSVTDAATATSSVLTTTNGFLPGAAYDGSSLNQGPASYTYPLGVTTTHGGMSVSYTGDGDRYDAGAAANDGANLTNRREAVTIDEAKQDLLLFAVGSGNFTATATWDYMPPAGAAPPPAPPNAAQILMEAPIGGPAKYLDIPQTPADASALGLNGLDLGTAPGATGAIGAFDQAIQTVSSYRASYGAIATRFESAIRNLNVSSENASAARSRILDADFATETAALSRNQILQQASMAILAQANQLPQQVLTLLRG